jgi:hypothetical protein
VSNSNPSGSDEPTSGTLSADEQVEYDRLEALEQPTEHPGVDWANEPGTVTEGDSADLRERLDEVLPPATDDERELRKAFPVDPEGDARYPVIKAAAYADEAANKRTYDTPWGRREMDEREVRDLEHQGLTCTPVDSAPETSLQDEKDAMSGVKFGSKTEQA